MKCISKKCDKNIDVNVFSDVVQIFSTKIIKQHFRIDVLF